MRETVVVQGILAVIRVVLVIAGSTYLSTSVPLGLLGAVGGLLVMVGAIVVVMRRKQTTSAHPHK
ncbi:MULTISPECIES: hypothetical protein [Cryobacterium]|uniref:hypothetical protein n=1 Tax=Cryobacterium TaxID=69578 RepID=UPI000CD471F4|nr:MULTISPECIES: hypothetical protein [Cryobacterium]POH67798.1 hypothetical protein C3B60_06160 [Cryobacterium zongtaii]TFC47800.1 hypothetical protein E3O57_02360 [Cryobacterium sp. TMN-39-2]